MRYRRVIVSTFVVMAAVALVALNAHHWATQLVCDSGPAPYGIGYCVFEKVPSPIPGMRCYELVVYQDVDGDGGLAGDFATEIIYVRPFMLPDDREVNCNGSGVPRF